jgi:hypothetical protein
MAVIFKPQKPIQIPNNDVNITIERRNRAPKSVGLTMVTAVAHVWFNTFFEGNGPEQNGVPDETGIFEIDWDKLDGIKGSSQKGSRAADRIAVVWRSVVPQGSGQETVIVEPAADASIPQMHPADWKGGNDEDPEGEKHLGLRVQSPDSEGVSRASSVMDEALSGIDSKNKEAGNDFEGLRSDAPDGQEKGLSKSDKAGQLESKETDGKRSGEDPLNAYAEKLPKPEGNNS